MPGLAVPAGSGLNHRRKETSEQVLETTEQVLERLAQRADRVTNARPRLSIRKVLELIHLAYTGRPANRVDM